METIKVDGRPSNVITVHEIGEAEYGLFDSFNIEWHREFGQHFVPYDEPRERDFVVSGILEIGSFNLPVLKFEYTYRKSLLIFKEGVWTSSKIGERSGGIVRLVDGNLVFVSESREELRKLIREER